MKIDLQELEKAKVLDAQTAEAIRVYYASKSLYSSNRMIVAFGILGAMLTGLGMVLIVAHNWDILTIRVKTILSLLPLLLGQAALGWALFKRPLSRAWCEASSSFLICAFGACISLISQIYHIEGDLSSFMFIWCFSALLIVYVARSDIASALYFILISFYVVASNDVNFTGNSNYWYWGFFIGILPYIVDMFIKRSHSIFTTIHTYIIPISICLGLGIVFENFPALYSMAYIALFGLLSGLGYMYKQDNISIFSNGFKLSGSLGTWFILFMASFQDHWQTIQRAEWSVAVFTTNTLYASFVLFFIASVLIFFLIKTKGLSWVYTRPFLVVFLCYAFIYGIGSFYPPLAQGLINILILSIGLWLVYQGVQSSLLGKLNYGLMVISILIACRFFDTEIDFIWRGLIFMALGFGFFAANYWIVKQRK